MKVVVVAYGSGNLLSVRRGFERVGMDVVMSDRPQDINDASHLVVPGVGAFSTCMRQLEDLRLLSPILRAIRSGKPYLGICLGLQILFSEGTESGAVLGLNVVSGKVVHFPSSDTRTRVPQMGWNTLQIKKPNALLTGIPDHTYFYFAHSYYGLPDDLSWVATTTSHGLSFPSMIAKDHVFGCQFHPEKSQQMGLRILSNFIQQTR